MLYIFNDASSAVGTRSQGVSDRSPPRRFHTARMRQLPRRRRLRCNLIEWRSRKCESCKTGATVLVVEREPLILDMISEELTDQGFAVLTADTGEAALSIVQSGETIDVLFTELRLNGDVSGGQLAAMVQLVKPELPVICGMALPGRFGPPDSIFLNKPYLPSSVVESVRILIARAKP